MLASPSMLAQDVFTVHQPSYFVWVFGLLLIAGAVGWLVATVIGFARAPIQAPIAIDNAATAMRLERPSAAARMFGERNGSEIVVEGFRAKDGTLKANGVTVKFTDGRNFFLGSSGTGTPGER